MRIVAFIPVYNEEDVIAQCIEHLISEGLEVVVLDNGSTDNTYQICKKYEHLGKIKLAQLRTDEFDESVIFEAAYQLAISIDPDWVLYSSADEIIESGKNSIKLSEFILQVDSEGFNLIQFDRYDFFMTEKDEQNETIIRKKMKYYSYLGDYLYRTWKFIPGIKIGIPGGHYPIFPKLYPYKIYPEKGILRHYTFRSREQALKKLKNVTRSPDGPKAYGNYARTLKTDYGKKIDSRILSKYNDDSNWSKEKTFNPYSWVNPPKREDIFTKKGFLRNPPKTLQEYFHLLEDERNKIFPPKLKRMANSLKRKIISKVKHS